MADFNPREFGIEPYYPHRRRRGAFDGSSFVSISKNGSAGISSRIVLKGNDRDTALEILGERCDVGTGGDCIYLYPGDSHSISPVKGGYDRRVFCAGLTNWVREHWGQRGDNHYTIKCEPFHNGRTIRISYEEE